VKSLRLVIWLASVALAGGVISVACGPAETYCYDQHKTCAQAKRDKDQMDLQKMLDQAAAAAALADAGALDAGAIVIQSGDH
jgi:hypothetical protein